MRPGFCSDDPDMKLPTQKLKLLAGFMATGLITPALAANLVVDNLNDDGPGTLRQAIEEANADPAQTIIEFEASLDGVLTLLAPLPTITEDVEILGPGAQQVSISGNQAHQILSITANTTVLLSGLSFIDGHSELSGGAIINEGALTIAECILSGNQSEFGAGGAIDNFMGELTIHASTLDRNEANTGGGIANLDGTVQIIDSTISNNQAALGGGIDNAGVLSIVHSTITGNSAELGGGVENAGELTVFNSTFSENLADDDGGGIDNFGGNVSLLHVTLAFNQATGDGGAVWSGADGSLVSKHSIIAGSDCFSEPGSDWTDIAVNFATETGCEGFLETTLTALALGSLSDNGGPTRTHALAAGSIALEAAEDCTALDGATAVSEDQRGVSRPQGEHCDVGAYERMVAVDPPPAEDSIFSDRFEQPSG